MVSFSEAEEVSLAQESVQASVSFSTLAHKSGQSDNVFLASHLSLFVNLRTPINKSS